MWMLLLTLLGAQAQEEATPTPAEERDLGSELDELRRELAEQRAALDEQKAELAAAKAALAEQSDMVSEQAMKMSTGPDFRVEFEGYYRVRGHLFTGLFENQQGVGNYFNQRLRLRTIFNYKDAAKLKLDIQALDDIVWGDNADIASTPIFASEPSLTGMDGRETVPIKLFRAWTEFKVPIGKMIIGRTVSDWGLGILVNSGDGFDDDFGENHYGSTFDRVMFATEPVTVIQKLAGKQNAPHIPLIMAIGVDRLVEDPLTQFYGYKCEVGIPESSPEYDPRCDLDGDGITDTQHDYTESRDANSRSQNWWADRADDVWEMIYVLAWRGNNRTYFGLPGSIEAGAQVIHRLQGETDSNIIVTDAYLKSNIAGVVLEGEIVGIFGRTRGLVLPGAYDPNGDGDPLAKNVSIGGYVIRAGYEQDLFGALFETGLASGDDDTADNQFTGRALHPDHNVGLILYEEVLARATAQAWGPDAQGLWSKGGVYNSYYINPRARVSPLPNTDIIAGFLMAWPHRPDGAIIRCRPGDKVECSSYGASSRELGWEVDLAIKHTWLQHLNVTLEAGYAKITDRIPLSVYGMDPNGSIFTLQSRVAWIF